MVVKHQSHKYLLVTLIGILLVSVGLSACATSVPTMEINSINEAREAVCLHLDNLAKTPYAKQFEAEFYDTLWGIEFSVFDSNGDYYHIEDYQGSDVQSYIVELAFPEHATLHGTLGDNPRYVNWHGLQQDVKLCCWVVNAVDGTVRPCDGNALRVEAELMK